MGRRVVSPKERTRKRTDSNPANLDITLGFNGYKMRAKQNEDKRLKLAPLAKDVDPEGLKLVTANDPLERASKFLRLLGCWKDDIDANVSSCFPRSTGTKSAPCGSMQLVRYGRSFGVHVGTFANAIRCNGFRERRPQPSQVCPPNRCLRGCPKARRGLPGRLQLAVPTTPFLVSGCVHHARLFPGVARLGRGERRHPARSRGLFANESPC